MTRLTCSKTHRPFILLLAALIFGISPPLRAQEGSSEDSAAGEEEATASSDDDSTDDTRPEVDEAWKQFHFAFGKLAAGDPYESFDILMRLRERRPDHASALFARPVLEALRKREELAEHDLPELPPRGSDGTHPAITDRNSAVYDAGWVMYREAFVLLGENKPGEARERLERMMDEHPDHPAGPLADDALEMIQEREPRAGASDDEADDTAAAAPTDVDGYRVSNSGRLLLEGAGGVLGSAVLGVGSGLTGFILGWGLDGGRAGVGAVALSGVGGVLGAIAGVPLGTYIGGRLGDGNGTFLAAAAGAGLGLLADILIIPATAAITQETRMPWLMAFGVPAPVLCAMWIYEGSHTPPGEAEDGSDSARLRPFFKPGFDGRASSVGLSVDF